MASWSVYLVRTRDGHLYTGVALDVERRLAEHRSGAGRGAKYLRGRGPLALVYRRAVGDRGLALRVERALKRRPRERKEAIVAEQPGRRALLRTLLPDPDPNPATEPARGPRRGRPTTDAG